MGRGKSDRMLVLIGVFKLAKAALLIVVGIGLVDPGWTGAQHLIVRVHAIDARREELLGAGTFAYAGLFLLEGVGLVLRKRWGEWVTVFITGSFVPFEIYELVRAFHWPRLAITIVNLAIVAYLIRRLRDHGTGIG